MRRDRDRNSTEIWWTLAAIFFASLLFNILWPLVER